MIALPAPSSSRRISDGDVLRENDGMLGLACALSFALEARHPETPEMVRVRKPL
jgi:hypothetical protein